MDIRRSQSVRSSVAWLLVATGCALAAVFAPAAHAVAACGFAGTTASVTMASGDTATLVVGTGVDTGKIMLNGVACGAATVMTTDTIAVTGSTGAETVTIDLPVPAAPWTSGG